jgi:hypothetical protein
MAAAPVAASAPQPTPMAVPPAAQQVWQAPPVQQPTYAYPVQQAPVQPVVPGSTDGKSDVISTGGYFLTLLLFSIPLIGWIACIIMAFASGNRNRRNLSRAMLIFLVIGLILSVVMYFVMGWIVEAVMEVAQPYVSAYTGGAATDLSSLSDLLGMLS